MFDNQGNKYAEKWTAEAVKENLKLIELEAGKEGVSYLGSALSQLRITRRAWSYWKKKFADHEAIMEHMELIEGKFEVKLFEAAMSSKMSAAVAIFGLKNNHHWSDKPVAEQAVAEKPARRPITVDLGTEVIVLP